MSKKTVPFNRQSVRIFLAQKFQNSVEAINNEKLSDLERFTGRVASMCFQEIHISMFGKPIQVVNRTVQKAAEAVVAFKKSEQEKVDESNADKQAGAVDGSGGNGEPETRPIEGA
jgi:hypothetical protein